MALACAAWPSMNSAPSRVFANTAKSWSTNSSWRSMSTAPRSQTVANKGKAAATARRQAPATTRTGKRCSPTAIALPTSTQTSVSRVSLEMRGNVSCSRLAFSSSPSSESLRTRSARDMTSPALAFRDLIHSPRRATAWFFASSASLTKASEIVSCDGLALLNTVAWPSNAASASRMTDRPRFMASFMSLCQKPLPQSPLDTLSWAR
mmetsp:Transcript_76261/g.220234  ORF Transcript_76261/g.220234 Transcript_76261/m.220234 type:complete len:207 (-) Transcript_76261:1521-2141(-)